MDHNPEHDNMLMLASMIHNVAVIMVPQELQHHMSPVMKNTVREQ